MYVNAPHGIIAYYQLMVAPHKQYMLTSAYRGHLVPRTFQLPRLQNHTIQLADDVKKYTACFKVHGYQYDDTFVGIPSHTKIPIPVYVDTNVNKHVPLSYPTMQSEPSC